ncbi:MAG: rhomboid family intramembrane serine protease [Methanobacteriota archaeon]|nr:MAG: rhomboid family intramembrane serine protease [Euryarchaeota archaeon]
MPLRELFFNAPLSTFILFSTIIVSYYTLTRNPSLLNELLLYPHGVIHERKYYMLLTHGFVHVNFLHLAINMFVFYSFAFWLEIVIGHIPFFIIYFGSLIIGGFISTIRRHHDPNFRSLGASGAISGILFSFILFNPNAKLLIFFFLPMRAWIFAVLFVAVSYYLARNRYSFIDHEGHLWGAVSGALLTILLKPAVMGHFFREILG